MNLKYSFVFLFLFIFSASVFAQCLTPIESTYESGLPASSCVSGYLHNESGWCEYQVVIPEGREEVFINYISNDIEFVRHFDTSDENLSIWIDRTTVPAYLSCAYYDPVKDDVFCVDKIEFGKSENWLPENVNYRTLTFEDDLNIKFLSYIFIIIGLWLIAVIGFNYKDFLKKRN